MNVEQLIDYIAAEVLKRVQLASTNTEVAYPKEKMLIIGEDEALVTRCKKAFGSSYDISTSNSYDEEGNYKRIVLVNTSTDLLVSAAVGLLGSRYKVLQDAIMHGKEVCIIEEGIEYRKYKDTCNKNFYDLLTSYEKQIESFGMKIVGISGIDKICEVKNELSSLNTNVVTLSSIRDEECKVKDSSDVSKAIGYKLVTEKILQKELDNGITTLEVAKGTLITPLAVDYAKQHNMMIIRK